MIPGFGLVFFAAISVGAFALPLRLRRRYEIENMWGLAYGVGILVIPMLFAQVVLPNWPSVLQSVGAGTVLAAMAFGLLWGIGSVTFALGVCAVGLSLGSALIGGIVTVSGSVIPLVKRWYTVPGDARALVLLGIGLCLLGVGFCGRAGVLRERSSVPDGTPPSAMHPARKVFLFGVFWCIVSGLFSACANLGFDFAEPISREFIRRGVHPALATHGRWLPVYWGGYISVLIFSGVRMVRRRSWTHFAGPGAGRDFSMTMAMALLLFLAQLSYGMGAHYLGRLGTSVGWAVYTATSLIVPNLFGFLIGEWKGASARAIHALFWGLFVLVLAMIALAWGNSLVPAPGR
ncbi:MAG: L-rhamnose/proton symporter RhaT [Candidatus Latescibacterota bacterium]